MGQHTDIAYDLMRFCHEVDRLHLLCGGHPTDEPSRRVNRPGVSPWADQDAATLTATLNLSDIIDTDAWLFAEVFYLVGRALHEPQGHTVNLRRLLLEAHDLWGEEWIACRADREYIREYARGQVELISRVLGLPHAEVTEADTFADIIAALGAALRQESTFRR